MSNRELVKENVDRIMMQYLVKYPIKSDKYINRESIAKCLKYVGGCSPPDFNEDYFKDVEIFMKTISELKIKIKYLDTNYYFPEDKEARAIYRIYVTRNNKTISFRFGASLQMTWNNEKPDLYDVLTSIQSDWSVGNEGYEEYCANFQVSEDSIKGLKTWKKIQKQFEKLDSMFREEELWSFPN